MFGPSFQIVSFLLISRINIKTTVSLSSPQSLIMGTWCLIRLIGAILTGMAGLLSHSNFFFRWFVRLSCSVRIQILGITALSISAMHVNDLRLIHAVFCILLFYQAFALQPCLMACDIISELYFANDINCLERRICSGSNSLLLWNKVFAVRDLLSISGNVRF